MSGWDASTKAAGARCPDSRVKSTIVSMPTSVDILLTWPQTLLAQRKVTACPSIRPLSRDHAGMNKKPGSVRDLIGDYIAEQCTVIIESEAQLRAGENVVHTTRVAARRLRSTIRVFPDLFDASEAEHLEEELVWWAGLLGQVRDLDILAQRQAALLAELPAELILGPVASTIEAELAVQRKQAADAMVEALDSERFRKLMGLMYHWRSDAPFTPAADASA